VRKRGNPTVKWLEDEENDSYGPKEARWRCKTKNRAECTSVVLKAHDSTGLQHLGMHMQLLQCVLPTVISWYTIRIQLRLDYIPSCCNTCILMLMCESPFVLTLVMLVKRRKQPCTFLKVLAQHGLQGAKENQNKLRITALS
jgi:hypothetical protein